MTIKRDTYDVAFLTGGDEQLTTVTVLGVDELRAEKAARGANVRGPQVDSRTKQVTDLGDYQNMEALRLWAALVRVGAYDDKAIAFLTTDYMGSSKVNEDEPGDVVEDPTRPAENTVSV